MLDGPLRVDASVQLRHSIAVGGHGAKPIISKIKKSEREVG